MNCIFRHKDIFQNYTHCQQQWTRMQLTMLGKTHMHEQCLVLVVRCVDLADRLPVNIWTYQVLGCTALLDKIHLHKEKGDNKRRRKNQQKFLLQLRWKKITYIWINDRAMMALCHHSSKNGQQGNLRTFLLFGHSLAGTFQLRI